MRRFETQHGRAPEALAAALRALALTSRLRGGTSSRAGGGVREVDGGFVAYGEPKRRRLGKSSPLSLSATSLPSSPSGAVQAVFPIEGVAAVSPIMVESPEHREGSPRASKASEGFSAGAHAETLSARGTADEVDVGSVVVACRKLEEIMDRSGTRGAWVGGSTGVAECEKRGLKSKCPAPPKKISEVRVLTARKQVGFHFISQPSKKCSQTRGAKWADSVCAPSQVVSVSSPHANARSRPW